MTLAQWITVVAALGGPAGLVGLILVLPQIRKLQAETSKVERDSDLADIDGAATLSTAALEQMRAALDRAQAAEEHTARVEAKLDRTSEEVRQLRAEMRAYRETALEHAAWDHLRIVELVRMGVPEDDIPPAPPLLPPREKRTPH